MFKKHFSIVLIYNKIKSIFMHLFQAYQTVHTEVFVSFLTHKVKQYKIHQQAVF